MIDIPTIITGPKDAEHTFIMAHGAGAAMDSPFMNVIADKLAVAKIRTFRFEFPYMAERRVSGKKAPPNRQPILLEFWHKIIEQTGKPKNLFIGGKSMGGRMASLIADDLCVKGLVCLGYPFHPPGKPEKLRTDHLVELKTPTLICQGERDALGNREEVESFRLSAKIGYNWAPDGDHSLKPRKKSGHSEDENLEAACHAIIHFMSQGRN